MSYSEKSRLDRSWTNESRYAGLAEGQTVFTSDGEKLGTIEEISGDALLVRKGFFFPKDFYFRKDDIQEVRSGEVHLTLNKADLAEWKSEDYEGWTQVEDINAGRVDALPRDEYKDRYEKVTTIPVREEELQARKTLREAGNVQLRKVVHTELKHFTVPVLKEEIRIERKPATGIGTGEAAGTAFKEETINIPVREEEVEVVKRPVVKEEVRVSKEARTEERQVEGEIRREEVKIDEGKTKRKAG